MSKKWIYAGLAALGAFYVLFPIPSGFKQYWPLIAEKARRYGVDPVLLAAIVWQESTFNPKAHNENKWENSKGLAQVNEAQTKVLANIRTRYNIPPGDLYDPEYNLEMAAALIKANRDDGFSKLGIWSDAAVYNGGPNGIKSGILSSAVEQYVQEVTLVKYGKIKAQMFLGLV